MANKNNSASAVLDKSGFCWSMSVAYPEVPASIGDEEEPAADEG